jgi:hypothetical protein
MVLESRPGERRIAGTVDRTSVSPLLFALVVSLILTTAAPRVSHAAWPHSPGTNLPICTAAIDQINPKIVSDGAGGAIVTWRDYRSGADYDIYAQHVLASGAVDGGWPADGRALCTAANHQVSPTIISDGAGGAIITWYDFRSGSHYDIYAQHVLASGAVDGAWPADGCALCTAVNNQFSPTIVSDGAGGAIVTWYDGRSGNLDIYAQHVLASGAVDGAWPADGRALCTAAGHQQSPTIVSDGAGGAIVSWHDGRSGNSDIYAQHVLASGAVDGAWPADGRALCAAANDQSSPVIVSDDAGGAIVTWYDTRSGSADIYAQHVLASGAVDGAWPADGRALCTAVNFQFSPTIVSDGAGGAVVTWYDFRSGAFYDIYAQHVLASGAVDGAWPADGRALCTAANDQYSPTIVSDGANGAIVTWQDTRSGSTDIYAQHVLASGAVDGAWPADGRALCTATGTQESPVIATDGAGGAIVTWYDFRSGTSYDIYAQRISPSGYLGNPEPRISSVRDVPNDNGGKVKVSWAASYLDTEQPYGVDHYAIFRSAPPNVARGALAAGARLLRAGEAEPLPGERAFFTTTVNAATYYWEYLAGVAANHFASTYSYTAPTTTDSMAAGNPKTAFLVVAYNANNTVFFASNADSGYSVDNVPPAAPAPFTGYFSGVATNLHWGVSAESDFSLYHLYRGATAGFTPGPGSLVTAQSDTGYFDPSTAWAYYKLSALDIHGNESGFVLVSPSATFSGNTAPGTNVTVTFPSVEVTFGSVTGGGQTQVVLQTGGPPPPSGFELTPTSPKLYYGITTTATFAGLVTVCVTYDPSYVNGKESKLKFMVYDTTLPGWVNITTTRDTAANVICGTTTHFSDFAVMLPLDLVAVDDAIPAGLQLYPCAPNPTTGGSAVRFALPRDSDVRLAIFDAGGRRVRELARGGLSAGEHTLRWDGRDASGHPVANGLYLVRLEADGVSLTQKLVSMR